MLKNVFLCWIFYENSRHEGSEPDAFIHFMSGHEELLSIVVFFISTDSEIFFHYSNLPRRLD